MTTTTQPVWTLEPCDCPYDGFVRFDPDVLCSKCRGTAMRPVHASLLDTLLGGDLFKTKKRAVDFAIENY